MLHQVMKGTLMKPPPAPTKPEKKPDHPAGCQLAAKARHLPRGFRFFVQKHLRGRKAHKQAKENRQRGAFEQGENAHTGHGTAQHNAGRQALDQIPTNRAALVVGAHAGDGGEDDGGHAGGNGHFDGQISIHAFVGQENGEKGHHDHAAANAQQTCQKTHANAQRGKFKYHV